MRIQGKRDVVSRLKYKNWLKIDKPAKNYKNKRMSVSDRVSDGLAIKITKIIIIITMFIQGNLFNTLSAVINEGPVSKSTIYYNKMLQLYFIK